MKKITALLTVLMILLCSCSREEPQRIITSDMLNITNTEESFYGCYERFNSVISAIKSKVSVLETEHNRVIEHSGASEYFLEEEYILTAFDPFVMKNSQIIRSFTPELNSENAPDVFALDAQGADIIYESDGETSFVLRFVSEEEAKEYSVEYKKKTDSFRYSYIIENSEGDETLVEFLEFNRTKSGTYVIQNNNTRCCVNFSDEGKITDFCCGQLSEESFGLDESIFDTQTESADKHWVLSRGKLKFSNIHTFENETLIHEDCSSGPWKSVEIDAKQFESAFYM